MTITHRTATVPLLEPEQLLRTTDLFARDHELLRRLSPTERSWHRLEATDHLEVWLIGWPPGTSTGWHDHAGSRGAFRTVTGTLTEFVWTATEAQSTALAAEEGRSFGPRHVHGVVNDGDDFAVSIHAYAPALRGMTRYAVEHDRLLVQGLDRAGRW